MEGLERIKILASEIKDEALLEIIKYLLSREDMNEKYLNEEKSLKQMVEFIRENARKQAKDGMAMIKDEVVFGWAIHYFDESNKELGLEKSPVASAKSPIVSGNAENNAEDAENNAENVEKNENIVQNKPQKSSKQYFSEGQLSLF